MIRAGGLFAICFDSVSCAWLSQQHGNHAQLYDYINNNNIAISFTWRSLGHGHSQRANFAKIGHEITNLISLVLALCVAALPVFLSALIERFYIYTKCRWHLRIYIFFHLFSILRAHTHATPLTIARNPNIIHSERRRKNIARRKYRPCTRKLNKMHLSFSFLTFQ